jgi:hypothetical protein
MTLGSRSKAYTVTFSPSKTATALSKYTLQVAVKGISALYQAASAETVAPPGKT